MKVVVTSKRIRYDLCLNRKITIIQGDSGSGKTTLLETISNKSDEVLINCEKEVNFFPRMLPKKMLIATLESFNDSVLIIDETCSDTDYNYVVSNQVLMNRLMELDIWVIITARDFSNIKGLHYSPKEVYNVVDICEFQEETKDNVIVRTLKPKYVNEF